MKPGTAAAKNTVAREGAIRIQARVIAEWEYNRFTTPTVAVTPAQTGDDEWAVNYGDVNTIALPNRPRAGIAKARSENGIKPLGEFRDTPQASRFYPSSPNDMYMYWGSLQRSRLSATNGAYEFDTPIQITVTYPEQVVSNKIVVGFETSYAKPASFSVEYSEDGTTWKTGASNPALGSNGITELYFSGLGWDVVPNLENPALIKAIRLKVYSMNKAYSHLDVLQFGARLQNDLTAVTVGYTVDSEVSDRSFIAPMGKASSNSASITLSNIDGRFNNHNENSLYYKMIDKKVKFTIDMGIETTAQGGTGYEFVREFTGWSDGWGSEQQATIDVDLKDSSVFLQEIDMPPTFLEGMTAGAVVWSVMDRLGMTNYAYNRATNDYGQIIPFFWSKEDATVWEQISDLAEATQTAVYFDENDVMQIRARKAMYADKQIDWNFDATANGLKLPDIISLDFNNELEVNKVDITYQPAAYSDFAKGLPKMETVWEPEEDTVVLRSSPLAKDLAREGTDLWIRQADAIVWPFESLVNIRGEILRYKGKEYGYYTKANVYATKVIYTVDEKNALDAESELYYWKNSFTGKFKVTDRHLFGSGWSNHLTEPNFTDVITSAYNDVLYSFNGGARNFQNGFMGVGNTSTYHAQYHYVKAETAILPAVIQNGAPQYYGTRVKFTEANTWNIAGLICGADHGDAGFYIELATTETVGVEGVRVQNEVQVKAMPANAPEVYPVSLNGDARGVKMNILKGVWYDLDVKLARSSADILITVYINGVIVGNWQAKPIHQPPTYGRFGCFVRGATYAEFEYLYGFSSTADYAVQDPDKSNVLDLIRGGYSSGFIEKEIKYNWKFVNPSQYLPGGTQYFPQIINESNFAFYEFGPVVHEVREFTVKFEDDKRPVGHSNLYITNPDQVEVVSYESDAFGARFMLANAARVNAIVKGEDAVTFGAENTVDQNIFIYGRLVYQEEEKIVTKNDLDSIRRAGVTKTEVSSRYIQTNEMAAELGQWIVDLWSSGVDEVTMKVFGNPFLQLGDLVTVSFPAKNMLPSTHKYFITKISSTFEGGYTTEVTLRRAKV